MLILHEKIKLLFVNEPMFIRYKYSTAPAVSGVIGGKATQGIPMPLVHR